MTDREQALETARRIMLDAHCRYCDVAGQDPRLKCSTDIQDSTQQIVDELLEAQAQILSSMAPKYCQKCRDGIPLALPPNEKDWHAANQSPKGRLYGCSSVLLRERAQELRAQKGCGK